MIFDRVVSEGSRSHGYASRPGDSLRQIPADGDSEISAMFFGHNEKLGISTVEIAAKLKIGQPSVSRSSRRGEKNSGRKSA